MVSPVVLIFVRHMTAPKCYMLPKFGENSTCSCKASKFSVLVPFKIVVSN